MIYETTYNNHKYKFEESGNFVKVYIDGEYWGVPQGDRFLKILLKDIIINKNKEGLSYDL